MAWVVTMPWRPRTSELSPAGCPGSFHPNFLVDSCVDLADSGQGDVLDLAVDELLYDGCEGGDGWPESVMRFCEISVMVGLLSDGRV